MPAEVMKRLSVHKLYMKISRTMLKLKKGTIFYSQKGFVLWKMLMKMTVSIGHGKVSDGISKLQPKGVQFLTS
jgi:hypothetical protein